MKRNSWSLQKRSGKCHVTEHVFMDGDICYTGLFFDLEQNLVRRDYSVLGWQKRAEVETEKPFSFWSSHVERKEKQTKEESLQSKQSPEELLRLLCEQEEEHTENVRFVLALMLERARKLRQQDMQDLGEYRILIYEHVKSGELFVVKDPKLKLSELDSLQEDVAMLLQNQDELK